MTKFSTRRQPIDEAFSVDYNQPAFWSILNEGDQQNYKNLRNDISILVKKNRNKETPQLFQQQLDMIKSFCIKGDERDSDRSIVCGILFYMPSVIAINIQQLKILMSKCKSSINNFLKKLGYKTLQQGLTQDSESKSHLLQNPRDSKKLTVRELYTPIYFDDTIKMDKFEDADKILSMNVGTDAKDPGESYPCPIKYREKIYDTVYTSKSIQTEFEDDDPNYSYLDWTYT